MFAKRETDIPEFGGKCPSCGHTRTTPPVPVDTIAVPIEVLQGVRDDIQYERNKIFYLMIRGYASEYDVGLAKERLTKTLASLDAVLEGE